MTDLETLLVDRLEARAERIPVPPAPLDALRRAAVVRRRRRPLVVLAAAAAVAVVAVGLAVLDPTAHTAPTRDVPVPAGPVLTPEATRFGIGHLSVERPTGPVEVATTETNPQMISSHSWDLHPTRVDGLRVLTTRVERVVDEWRALVWVPSERVGLVISSPIDAAGVEDLLATLRVDPDRVAVPDVVAVDHTPLSAAAYLALLRDLGLESAVSVAGGSGVQRVDSVDPAVGTVVPLGTRVEVVTVDQEPTGRP